MTDLYVDTLLAGSVNGATVVWNSTKDSRKGVVFGTTGFSTLASAITALESGGTIWLASGTVAGPTTITKSMVIRGTDGTISQAATIVVSGVAVRFRDVTFLVSSGSLTTQVQATSGATVGFMHCTFSGSSATAAESSGAESGVAVVGCTFGAGVTEDKKVVGRNGGGASIYAATTTPVGGPSGRKAMHYRYRMRLDAPAEYRELSKGQKIIWVPVDMVNASIEPLRGEELMAARLGGANATHRIEMPGGVTVTPAFRVVHRGRNFELGTPLPTDTRENRVSFLALERVA